MPRAKHISKRGFQRAGTCACRCNFCQASAVPRVAGFVDGCITVQPVTSDDGWLFQVLAQLGDQTGL